MNSFTCKNFIRVLAAVFFILPLYVFVASNTLFAQATPQINYQGKLADSAGSVVADGSYNMRFWLFQNTGQATTSALWTEELTGSNQVQVVNGLFSVMLGSTTSMAGVDFAQPLYLGVEIGGVGAPAWDGEMLPRKPLGTVPAAFVAESANSLAGIATSSFLRSDAADSMAATEASTLLTIQQNGTGDILNILGSTSQSALFVGTDGNVGIGTTSPNAKLSVENIGFSGAGVVGIDQYLQTENSVASAVQFGNRFFLNASNTATTTVVGSIYRVADDTTFGNTVRGLEVQTNRGSNTQGENTAVSGFARTFGVRGVTTGDAGGTFEPAGGFFETQGTTQGSAVRGYSNTITTASLLSLFQDTSAFTGTGLEMNFGNTTGDFSSTTSKYLDFQNAGTSVFTVSAFGTTTIGDGTTNNMAGLQIGYGGICVDNDGTCTASTTGRITAVESQTGNSDLAEMYFSDQELEPGELVVLRDELSVRRATEDANTPILGVVSTKPGLTLGFDDVSTRPGETGYPLALKGRVPVKLSNENGPIKAGDSLMLSSLPGVAMKSDGTGTTVGIALEDFNENRLYSDTYINQFGDDIAEPDYTPVTTNDDPRINDGCYYGGGSAAGDEVCVPLTTEVLDEQVAEANEIAASEAIEDALFDLQFVTSDTEVLENGDVVSVGQIVMFVDRSDSLLAPDQLAVLDTLMGTSSLSVQAEDQVESVYDRLVALANRFVAGVLSVFELRADRVEVAEELCIDGVCVTADDLRTLLDSTNSEPEAQILEVPTPATSPSEPETTNADQDDASNSSEEFELNVEESVGSSTTEVIEVASATSSDTATDDPVDIVDEQSATTTTSTEITGEVSEDASVTENTEELEQAISSDIGPETTEEVSQTTTNDAELGSEEVETIEISQGANN